MKMFLDEKNLVVPIEEVNRRAADPPIFIEQCEAGYHTQLDELVNRVLESNGVYRVVLLAGPSSSGKTTTAHKLSERFAANGMHAPVVSLDDFFMGLVFYPKLPDGTPDMEAVEALDLPLINATLKQLVETGEADFPVFDFTTSSRSDQINHIALGAQGVLIVEGLHALNPRLVEVLDPKTLFRSYVSPHTKYTLDGREVLSPKDMRLIRRMVRDYNFRNRSPLETLLAWEDVLDGEEKYIHPFRDTVDYKIDSALDYESCVFHNYILPIIDSVKADKGFSGKAEQIINILEIFLDISERHIPPDSLLREFVGH